MVDATTGYERLTFLDAYSGYNQIPMDPEDEEKTAFITEKGTYCYRVMPLRLKNAGATYQRLVNKIFDNLLGKTVEAYIDDMVVKSVKKEDHPKHLQEVFNTLKKYNMKLNPSKCSFAVSSDKCKPFFDAIRSKNKDIWGPQQKEALSRLKGYMAEPPILSAPKPGEVLIMYLAIFNTSTSATLIRNERKRQYPIFYTSKTMTDAETYPIRGILSKPNLSGRITKWAIELSSVDITYEPKVSHKGQAVADFLLEYEDTPEEPAHPEPQWELRVDGSSNQASAGVGVVMSTPEGTKLQQSICLKFPATNNELTCQYHPKEERMKAYKEVVENVARGFDQIEFYQVPRVENAEADQLATSASSSNEDLIRIVPIDVLDEPSINPPQEVMVIPVIPREPCWIDPLEAYLKHGVLPDQKSEARKLRIIAAKYAIINNQLYRKSFSGLYLKCLSPTEALAVLRQIYDGDCGNHSGGRSLAHKVLTQGYFWPYLSRNVEEYTRRCDKCQRHGPLKHQLAEDLHAMVNPWPFAQWGIDMVGPLPKTVEQKECVLLATDYFTKWVEAEAYSSVTHEQVKSFLWNNIIYRFGVPKVIMMDNGKNLDNRSTRKFFAEHGIVQKLAAVSHPQGNGQAEITNRTIFQLFKEEIGETQNEMVRESPSGALGVPNHTAAAYGRESLYHGLWI
ncbi:uncharacterized protein LOC132276269 [Cornus florida]|uniref:uncharacterized protein LOC132276269 n=1 Tax=Cornus florida TaxID=4283 RepID=UPI00289C64F7|nr:uncharacterized protein LOC132276269 [Cornus florida]